MSSTMENQYQPNYAVPPGDVLDYELETRGMSKKELALRTGITPKHINEIVQARASITPDTALKFERAIGMPADYWLNLESQYQEIRVRLSEEEQLERDLEWLKKIPVNDMSKMDWIKKHKDKKDMLVEVLRFFGIASIEQWDDMWPNLNVAYRQHNKHEVFPESVSAWLRQGEKEASDIQCQPYSKAEFRSVLDKIRSLTAESPDIFVPAMQDLCSKAGVAVVFVPALPKTGVSGATRWLNPNKAIIQLSLRYKTNDHLWFTFFHEAGHILLHGKKELFLEGANGLNEEKENEANKFAENELIPKKPFSEFLKEGCFTKVSIIDFADEVGVASGIVVGQLQHKKLLSIRYCNDLKQRYRWVHELVN